MSDDLIEIAIKMAQELQDFVGEAEKSGSGLPGTVALLEEWEVAYQKDNNMLEILVLDDEDLPAIFLVQAD